jgi:glutaconate CoA-transferase, subunit B
MSAGPTDTMIPPTPRELMVISAARALVDGQVCFVGIGAPSTAANLARASHAPQLVLVYESGCIGAKPTRLPLSIGDGELSKTSDTVVSVAEIFTYWLQSGRIDVGFLGAAQIDRFANLNTTVVGPYNRPTVRLPGAGGAPEIAAGCRSVEAHGQTHQTTGDVSARAQEWVEDPTRKLGSGHHAEGLWKGGEP